MNIKEILFWISLILALILLVWNVFGNSPSEFITLVAILFAVLLKTWSISDRQIKSEMRFNNLEHSFAKLIKDFKQHIKHK